jgi:hypothetical protein
VTEKVIVGNAATPADEADVALTATITDVRNQGDLSDYVGELGVETTLRITDRNNAVAPGDGTDPATTQQVTFSFPLACAATSDAAEGSTCATSTTADAVMPGVVVENKRSIWETGQTRLFDGGADGLISTPGNTLFAVGGVFVP